MAAYPPPSRQRLPNIACCLCGASIQPNGANMCVACLGKRYKITAPLDELRPELLMCKNCGAWRTGNKGRGSGSAGETWAHAEPESAALMGICLKQGVEHLQAQW